MSFDQTLLARKTQSIPGIPWMLDGAVLRFLANVFSFPLILFALLGYTTGIDGELGTSSLNPENEEAKNMIQFRTLLVQYLVLLLELLNKSLASRNAQLLNDSPDLNSRGGINRILSDLLRYLDFLLQWL